MAGSGNQPEPKTNKMKAKRRRHEPEFKARVALEALKGAKTIQQIAKEYDIHPVQVSDWKKTMTEGLTDIFGPGRKTSDQEDFDREKSDLHAKIGQQAVEIDFLIKKSRQLGL
ncbi:hypothetical protein BH11VER1_BH11VER1_23170 [soil metagenome]